MQLVEMATPQLKLLERDEVLNVCKMGQGEACCRYLVCGSKGFECAKHGEFMDYLDGRVKAGTMVARGDNCEGKK
jgi:hypothetical protein